MPKGQQKAGNVAERGVKLHFPHASGKENSQFGSGGFSTTLGTELAQMEGDRALEAEEEGEEGGGIFDTLFSPMFKFFRKGKDGRKEQC